MNSNLKKINLSIERIIDFCNKWQISRFSLFGSVLRADFSDTSDVDVLIDFHTDVKRNFRGYLAMIEELEDILGRRVDLVVTSALKNPYIRAEILRTQKVLYEAA